MHSFREAIFCNSCFAAGQYARTRVDLPQPRFIGSHYYQQGQRVAIVLTNPGSGENRAGDADDRFRSLLRGFAQNLISIDDIFAHERVDIPKWGKTGVEFKQFYLDGFGLELDDIALVNIAWCSTEGNRYRMNDILRPCFEAFTEPLIQKLEPTHIILGGIAAQAFLRNINLAVPGASVLPTLHFSHREGKEREQGEILKVKNWLAATKPKVR